MKLINSILLIFLLTVISNAQSPYARRIIPTDGTPLTCSENQIFWDMLNHRLLVCETGNALKQVPFITVGGSIGTLTGTGVSGRVSLWSGASSLTNDSGFTFSGTGSTFDLTIGRQFIGQSLAINGTAGNGFVNFISQSSNPSIPISGFNLFADSTGRLSWRRNSDGFIRTFDATLTADRIYTLPNADTKFPIFTQIVTFAGFTSARTVTFPDANITVARTDAGNTWTGNQIFSIDNTYDIGASGANRPRNIYAASTVGGLRFLFSTSGSIMGETGNGILGLYNAAESDFSRLQFGGTTSSFPSIKRSGTGLIVRLADDSADTDLTAKSLTLTSAPTWITPTLLNSWTNLGGGNSTAQYTKTAGLVCIKGVVQNGSTIPSVIFTLPVGYRPSESRIFVTISNAAMGYVGVNANGNVVVNQGSTTYVSMDVPCFPAEQ